MDTTTLAMIKIMIRIAFFLFVVVPVLFLGFIAGTVLF